MKNKIFAYACAFALVLSLLVVPSFALENDLAGDYEFSDSLVFSPNGGISSFFDDASIHFYSGGLEFDSMHLTYRGYWVLQYINDSSSIDVYNDSGWVNPAYKSIIIVDYDSSNLGLADFLSANSSSVSYSGWYYDIYDILHSAVFDGNDLTGAQDMVLTLLSVVFCCIAVALPVIVVLFFVKYVLSMRFY